ncbi:hypothetical protein COCVIDRAFT_95792, partial [Bipolaris victoriae FI3]
LKRGLIRWKKGGSMTGGRAVFLGFFGIYRSQVRRRAAFTLSSALCYISVSYTRHDCTTSGGVSMET